MRLLRLRRFAFAFWLGLLALTASGVAQNQLSTNVLVAALTDHHGAGAGHDHQASAGHYMPDGTFMPGAMHHADASKDGGHSHKGHSDCTMCSAVAAMAGLTTAVIAILSAPQAHVASEDWIATRSHIFATSPAYYSSRAPPAQIG